MSVKLNGLQINGYIRKGGKPAGLDAESVAEFRTPFSAGLRGFVNVTVKRKQRLISFQEIMDSL
jgi:hypothetical protein